MSDTEVFQQFQNIRQAGRNACLSLVCHAGQVWMQLQVYFPATHPHHQFHHPPQRNSPSRQRRQARRQAARDTAAAESAVKVSTDAIEAVKATIADNDE